MGGKTGLIATLPFLVLALVACPYAAVLAAFLQSGPEDAWAELTYRPFLATLGRSAEMFLVSGSISLLAGWLLGTALALFRFPGRTLCLLVLLLPVTFPPFLLAIGIQSLKAFTSFRNEVWFDGFSGCVETYSLILTPVVALTVYASTLLSQRSEIESTLLSGGLFPAFRQLMRSTFPSALGAGILGILLLVSDAGCGQLMGVHGIAGELLVEFSANHDLSMAAFKATVLLVFIAPIALLAGLLISRSFGFQSSSRTTGFRSLHPTILPLSQRLPFFGGIVILSLLPPLFALVGILTPLSSQGRFFGFDEAFRILEDSAGISFFYAVSSALFSCVLGLTTVIALPPGASRKTKQTLLTVSLILFAIPPMISAIGVQWIASQLPAALDPITRGPLLVSLGCGLRNAPIAILFLLPAWDRIPRGRRESLLLSPLSPLQALFRYIVPSLRVPLVAAFSLTGLLSIADATSLVFLQPPGELSFGSHLFAMMDNTPRQIIASMCLLYFLFPIALLGATRYLTLRWNRAEPR